MQSRKINRTTSSNSPYHEFEISFGAHILKDVNNAHFQIKYTIN